MDTLASTEKKCDQGVHMQPLISSTQHTDTLGMTDFQKAGALPYPSLGCFNELQVSFQITFENLGTSMFESLKVSSEEQKQVSTLNYINYL